MQAHVFRSRRDAGRQLAERLRSFAAERPVVIGLPRGGVPVAFEVASALDAPLDVLIVRKIGSPWNPELGIGAIAEGGVRVLNERALRILELTPEEIARATQRAERELRDRLDRYRGERLPLDVTGRTVIVVDDGLATGGTARAALRALRADGAARLVLAVPVGAPETIRALEPECDEVVCLVAPEPMRAIGYWYEDFTPTGDAEVGALLAEAARAGEAAPPAPAEAVAGPPARSEVRISVPGGAEIVGDLAVPQPAAGLAVFAHGSGSSRHSPRNRQVATALNQAGLATLLIDLLTPAEERDRANVFDIALLAERLVAATHWAREHPATARLRVGYFGASTGAGAAMWAAAELGAGIGAIVSRGGRPDLAAPLLGEVRSPTLLIVGGLDGVVIELNRDALIRLRCEAVLEIVPGATHLFEEPGTLEQVERLAVGWFTRHLAAVASPGG